MALLWMDGFDHYGKGSTGRTNMLAGSWADVASAFSPSTTQSRTGGASVVLTGGAWSAGTALRRIFGSAKVTAGVGYGFYTTALPSQSNKAGLFVFSDFNNAAQVSVVLQPTGAVTAYRGALTEALGTSADGVIVAEAWQHIECAVTISDSVGSVEVRVNGVTVLSVSGVDTKETALTEVSQFSIRGLATYTGDEHVPYFDDMFAWDSSGSSNNTFIGDRRVRTLYPTADTAVAEWTANGTTYGYDAIDDTAPDGDTTYVAAGVTIPTTSEYALEDLPASVVSVNALQTVPMVKKTEAGDGNLQVSLISGASVDDGVDRPVTTAYTYWADVSETDPATSAPWTPSGVNGAKLRIKRTA